jgi:methyl-accepting chemotaxis protein
MAVIMSTGAVICLYQLSQMRAAHAAVVEQRILGENAVTFTGSQVGVMAATMGYALHPTATARLIATLNRKSGDDALRIMRLHRAAAPAIVDAVVKMAAIADGAMMRHNQQIMAAADAHNDRLVRELVGRRPREIVTYNALDTKLEPMLNTARDIADSRYAAVERQAALTVAISLAAGLLGCVALLIIRARSLSRRIQRVSSSLENVTRESLPQFVGGLASLSEGNLDLRLSHGTSEVLDEGGDEIAVIGSAFNELQSGLSAVADSFNATVAQLRGTVAGVMESSAALNGSTGRSQEALRSCDTIVGRIALDAADVLQAGKVQDAEIESATRAVQELSGAIVQIARGTQVQAQATRDASENVDTVLADVSSIAQSVRGTAEASSTTFEACAEGVAAVLHMAGAIELLQQKAAGLGESMSELEQHSRRIEDFVSVVSEIADRTNLLSLNAAIEAARAGEHGRGFAVVAQEVGKLPESCSSAAESISSGLGSIRERIVRVNGELATANSALSDSTKLTESVQQQFQRASRLSEEVSASMMDVSRRAESIEARLSSVASGMRSIAVGVDENAASCHEVQASATTIAQHMREIASASQTSVERSALMHTNLEQMSGEFISLVTLNDAVVSESKKLAALSGFFSLGAASLLNGTAQHRLMP